MRAMELINWTDCVRLAGGRPDIAKEMLSAFIDELPDFQNVIADVWEQGDLSTLGQQVHKLHGGCCYTGVPSLKQAATYLEEALQQGQKELDALVLNLVRCIQATLEAYPTVMALK